MSVSRSPLIFGRYGGTAVLAAVLCVSLAGPAPARASQGGDIARGIIELLFEAAKREQQKKAYEAWVKQPPEIIVCLQRSFGINADQLVRNGIGPDDRRVQPYVERCAQALRQARARAAEAERQRRAAAEAARQEAERRAQEAAARREAQRQARIDDLKSRFPDPWVPGILAGRVELGWSREAVQEALGPPRAKMRTPDGAEMWTYPSQRIVFTDGKVSYVGE